VIVAPGGESWALPGDRPLCPNVNLSLNWRDGGISLQKRESLEGKTPETLGNIRRGGRALKEEPFLLSAPLFALPPSGKIPELLWLGTNYSFGLPARKANWGWRNCLTQCF